MRLQVRHLLLSWAISCTCTVWLAPPAHSQTFLQTLFGFNTPQPDEAREPTRPIAPNRLPRRSPEREQPESDDEIGPPDSGGPYRTMCVRACDGFYFPIRQHALRRNFPGDIKACRSACGDEARLYYFPESGGSIDTMTDLAGGAYKDTPQAFAYRKALVSGCSCRPDPWSKEEAARHRGYAEAEAAAEARRAATGETADPAVADQTAQTTPPTAPDNEDSAAAQSAAPQTAREPQTATDETTDAEGNGATPGVIRAETDSEADAVMAGAVMAGQDVRVPPPRRAERARRKFRSRVSRVRYGANETSFFGTPKSPLVWPGD